MACRTLLKKNPKVELREGVTITGFLTSEDKNRICGVSVERGGNIEADFVVDATGASSKSIDWLEKLGYQRPPISYIKPRLTYTSRLFERKPNQAPATHNWDAVLCWPPSFESKRGALLTPIEENIWHCSLGAECGDPCPKTDEGYLDFAKSLGIPHVYDIIKDVARARGARLENPRNVLRDSPIGRTLANRQRQLRDEYISGVNQHAYIRLIHRRFMLLVP